jgi:formate hydrogenlyase subunit 6/NADH:ubiquinone oxidoreductase subunit I
LELLHHLKSYFGNVYEAVSTISVGMWITFKTAFFERKVTIQYPSHDILKGALRDTEIPSQGEVKLPFEVLLGASQQKYKGPLNTQVAERYRGLLGYAEPICIACLLCAQNCPIDVIRVKGVKIEGRKGKAPTTFRIDYSKCMFCGICVEVCPTNAIFFTRQFEGATFDYRTLIREFITPELSLERMQLAEQAKKKPEKEKLKEEKEDKSEE